MKIALVHNHYDPDHLAAVIEEMKILGAPTIKAVWMECYGHYAALEGCHRIRAAKALGLVPEIEDVEYSDELVEGMQDDVTVEQIADSSNESVVIEFED